LVRKRLDYPAISGPPVGTRSNHPNEFGFKSVQPGNSILNRRQLVACNTTRLCAGHLWIILQMEESADFGDAESKVASVANKGQSPRNVIAVHAPAAFGSRRGVEEANALVEADRLNIDACARRKPTDCKHGITLG
jgi:hypothetical protein